MLDWQKQLVRRTVNGAGNYPGVQLQFLLQRLEQHPEALGAIADAIRDIGEWAQRDEDELEAEGRRRSGGAEIVPFEK